MIIHMILKNLKIIFRSPFTIFLLILTPIILMFIIGVTYSGNSFTHTTVGLIESNSDVFNLRGVSFKEFNEDNVYKSRDMCIESLKKSEVEICIDFKQQYDSYQNLVSAQLIYYTDETRPQLSSIIIKNFNNIIDEQTKEISTKTVKDIFGEIKDTVVFMNESLQLIEKIEKDLSVAKNSIIVADNMLDNSKNGFKNIYDEIKNIQEDLNSDIDLQQNTYNLLKSSLSDYENSLDDSQKNIENSINTVDQLINDFNIFGALYPDLYNYVDLNDLYDLRNDLDDSNLELNNIKINTNNLNNNLVNMDSLDKVQETINQAIESLNGIDDDLDKVSTETKNILNNVKEREKEVKNVKNQIKDKLNYFDILSKKDASTITEPISKKTESIMSGEFGRVHQLSPTVVILVLLFIGLLLSNVIVSLEINSKAYFRNLISPVPQRKFIFALFFTTLFVILLQVFFLLLILFFSFNVIAIRDGFITIFIIVIHLLIVFILTGIFLSFAFSLIQVSILVTTFVMLFMFLLSDIIIPLEIMPSYVFNILQFNPVVLGENLIRRAFFFSNFSLSFSDLIIFYPMIFILILLIWAASSRRKKKLF